MQKRKRETHFAVGCCRNNPQSISQEPPLFEYRLCSALHIIHTRIRL